MRKLVDDLCSERCAGRKPGTPEGLAAREVVRAAFRDAGLKPVERPIRGLPGGANLIATLPGNVDRFVLIGAHYDHLGRHGDQIFWGADDNAAAVAIMIDVARALTTARPAGRGVIFAAFDAEEPPYYLTARMGSESFASDPTVPLEKIDMMVCMDLVGHAVGGAEFPAEVRDSILAMGAEKSEGTAEHVERLARAVPGLIVRRADIDVIPPMSDYDAFRGRGVPFLFLSSGQWRYYHTPDDRPERLDYAKMAATARWLERFVRETCARPEPKIRFRTASDDRSSLLSLIEICSHLEAASPAAAMGKALAEDLLSTCDAAGVVAADRRREIEMLVGRLEQGLA